MFTINDIIQPHGLGHLKLIIEVTANGVIAVNVRRVGDAMDVVSKPMFVSNEELGSFKPFKRAPNS